MGFTGLGGAGGRATPGRRRGGGRRRSRGRRRRGARTGARPTPTQRRERSPDRELVDAKPARQYCWTTEAPPPGRTSRPAAASCACAERGIDAVGDEVEPGPALHSIGEMGVMGEHGHGMVGRRIAEPQPLDESSSPPLAADGPEHVAAHDRGADAGARAAVTNSSSTDEQHALGVVASATNASPSPLAKNHRGGVRTRCRADGRDPVAGPAGRPSPRSTAIVHHHVLGSVLVRSESTGGRPRTMDRCGGGAGEAGEIAEVGDEAGQDAEGDRARSR